jgi:hypothetical protein
MSKKSYEPDGTDFRNISVPEIKIDPNDPNSYSARVATERETRNKLLSWSRQLGYEKDMLILFAKFDKMIKNCPNEAERKDMAKLGWHETLKLMGSYGTFIVDGQVVYSKEDDQRYSLLLNKEDNSGIKS